MKPDIDPDMVFPPTLINGNFIPIIAAKVSPTDKNNNEYILYGYGINSIVNKATTNNHVAPVT